MAVTQTTRAARIIISATGRGWAVFNDRLKDGRRSLKVWGWTRGDYTLAKCMLEQAGCTVDEVEFNTGCWRKSRQVRLHVAESA